MGSSNLKASYTITEELLGKLRPIRVIIIGAGVSGIDMLHTLKQNTTDITYVAYEKNPEIGGTWYENRYPGCASDDPAYVYQYTHSPNPNWSSVFAPARAIKTYLNDVVEKIGTRECIKCGYVVEKAAWSEESAKWGVTVKDVATGQTSVDHGEFFIDASGIFNDWKWPNMKNIHNFQGDLIHTANWPIKGFKYQEKTVAVIGNGASGIQIIPAIQPNVKKLLHLLRNKTWIPPPSAAVQLCRTRTEYGSQMFKSTWIRSLNENSLKHAAFLKELRWLASKDRLPTLINQTKAEDARKNITEYMTSALQSKPYLIEKLIPSFPVGCRRVTSSESYLACLTADNVSVITSPIRSFTSTGIELISGEIFHVDAIICATGFNTSFIPRFPLIGEGGRNLQDTWKEENGGPKAYMSCMVEGMPNYYRFLGPNGPLAHGAIPELTTPLSHYILSHMHKLQLEHLSSIRVLADAVEEFNEHVQAFMPRTAWAGLGCGGWYKVKLEGGKERGRERERESEGRVIALHPGSQAHWVAMLGMGVRWEDFEFRRVRGNRFAYLGNGFAVEEGEREGEGTCVLES